MAKKKEVSHKKSPLLFLIVILLFLTALIAYAGLVSSSSSEVLTVVKRQSQQFQAQVLEERKSYWFWEKLLPHFFVLLEYPLATQQLTVEFEYQLAEAKLYSQFIVGEPQFLYRLHVVIDYLLPRQMMQELILDGSLETPEQLASYYLNQEEILKKFLQEQLTLEEAIPLTDIARSLEEQFAGITPTLKFKTLTVKQWQQPDWQLYEQARSSYQNFLSTRGQQLIQENIVDYLLQNRTSGQLERLKNLGEILKEYPQVLEYFKTVGEIQPNWKVEDILPLS